MLCQDLEIVAGRKFHEFLPLGVHHADFPVVEVRLVVLVHGPHGVEAVGVSVAQDHVHVSLVAEHHLIERR